MVKPPLTGAERTFRLVLYDALASEAMGTLTTGVFLAGFMVDLGASNLLIGVLAAVPFAVQFLQLPAVVLVERLRTRRAICTWSAAIGRTFLIVAAMAPFVNAEVGVHRADRRGRAQPGPGGDRGLFLELLDARPGPRDRVWPVLRTPGRGNDGIGDRAGAGLRTADRPLESDGAGGIRRMCIRACSSSARGSASSGSGCCRSPRISRCRGRRSARRCGTLLAAPFRDANFRRLMIFLASWNFAAQPRGAVFRGLHAQDRRVFDDHDHHPDDGKPAQQSRGPWSLGQPDRPVQQQSGFGRCSAIVSDVHPGLELHRTGVAATGGVLCPAGDPCVDGDCHGGRGARVQQYRDETIAVGAGDRVPSPRTASSVRPVRPSRPSSVGFVPISSRRAISVLASSGRAIIIRSRCKCLISMP